MPIGSKRTNIKLPLKRSQKANDTDTAEHERNDRYNIIRQCRNDRPKHRPNLTKFSQHSITSLRCHEPSKRTRRILDQSLQTENGSHILIHIDEKEPTEPKSTTLKKSPSSGKIKLLSTNSDNLSKIRSNHPITPV